ESQRRSTERQTGAARSRASGSRRASGSPRFPIRWSSQGASEVSDELHHLLHAATWIFPDLAPCEAQDRPPCGRQLPVALLVPGSLLLGSLMEVVPIALNAHPDRPHVTHGSLVSLRLRLQPLVGDRKVDSILEEVSLGHQVADGIIHNPREQVDSQPGLDGRRQILNDVLCQIRPCPTVDLAMWVVGKHDAGEK